MMVQFADGSMGTCERVVCMGDTQRMTVDAGFKVHVLVKQKMREQRIGYSEALKAVLSDPRNEALKIAFARE